MVRTGYNKVVAAIYHDEDAARDGLEILRDAGFDTKQISLITNREEVLKSLKEDENVDAGTASGAGAASGAAIGALGGLVIGVGSLLLPGIGGLIIAGPFASALGLVGGATATGAATGAITGGLLGLLTKAGMDESDAKHYSEEIETGNILILVPTTYDNVGIVERILAETEADHVKTAQFDETDQVWDRLVYA